MTYPPVYGPTYSGVPPVVLPGNILTVNDSDFENGTTTWTAETNAKNVNIVTNHPLTGGHCLSFQAIATGDVYIESGRYPIAPGKGCDVSGWIYTFMPRNTYIGLNWYTSSGTLISSSFGNDNPSNVQQWQPIVGALTPPSNATQAAVAVWVSQPAANETMTIDLMYLTQPPVQVLIDWANPTFAPSSVAGLDFADITPFVRFDQAITITRGRQDGISEIQAGQASLQVQNDNGWLTPNNSVSLYEAVGTVTLGMRTQINVADQNGNWHTRFDGQISELDYTIDTTGNTNVCTINLSDCLAMMNREDQMQCWTKEMVLAANPVLHWSLNDYAESTQTSNTSKLINNTTYTSNTGNVGIAAETSGNNGPDLHAVLYALLGPGTPTLAWANNNGGVETQADAVLPGNPDGSQFWYAGSLQPNSLLRGLVSKTTGPYFSPLESPYFTPALVAQTAQNTFIGNIGYTLVGEFGPNLTMNPNTPGNNYSIEAWFTMDPTIASSTIFGKNFGPFTVFSLGSSRQQSCLVAGIYLAGSALQLGVATYSQPPSFVGTSWGGMPVLDQEISISLPTDDTPIPHHLVVTFTGKTPSGGLGGAVSVWLDGVEQTGMQLPAGQTFDTITVGGAFGGGGGYYGNITLVSIYDYLLSQGVITEHSSVGQFGMWESSTDDCIAQLSQFSDLPQFWNSLGAQHGGLTLSEYFDITGSSPLTAMQSYEQTELGLLFVNADGQLTFHTRDWRMGYPAPDLLLPPDVYTSDMGLELVDQYLLNEAAFATVIYPAGVDEVNIASQNTYGTYANGTAQAPTQLPLLTWSRAYGMLGLQPWYYWPDPILADAASWQANARSQPYLAMGSLTLDLLTLDPTSGLTVSQLYALEIDNMVGLTGILPSSFPNVTGALELFIEGVQETISNTVHTLQLYASPALLQRAWKAGDSTYGQLGRTSRIGVSQPDVSTPQALGKDVSHDAGPPYWPPSFATEMNNPAENGHGFVGGLDIRGLVNSMRIALQPPMMVCSAMNNVQTYPSGPSTAPQVKWDTVFVDTVGGMGAVPGWPNWYVCLVPGFYEIDASLIWALGTSGRSGVRTGYITVAKQAAQAVAAGTGNPETVGQYVCPVGEEHQANNIGINTINASSTRMYLGLGDMVTVCGTQSQGSNDTTGTDFGGSMFSVVFCGYGTQSDEVEINSAIGNTSTVTTPTVPTVTTKTFNATAVASYLGNGTRLNTTGPLYQGQTANGSTGSQFSLIEWPASTIAADLAGMTILNATLTATNLGTWYNSGTFMRIGWSTRTTFGSTLTSFPASGTDYVQTISDEWFAPGQTKTFAVPASYVQNFTTGSMAATVIGDGSVINPAYYGDWSGTLANWTLTVTYEN